MSSYERKFRRQNAKKQKKATADVSKKLELMGGLGNKCLTCEKPFDKTNKEEVKTWSVVVREEEGIVRLYCPQCWGAAAEILQGFKEHLKNKQKKEDK